MASPSAPNDASADEPPATNDRVDATRLGIRELRGRLTSLVRRAGGGERIIVTIAGRPIAQLGPVEAAGRETTLDDLVARGLVLPARRGDRPARPDVVIDTWTGGRLDRALREVRGA
jgi:prevent-host-death family protein